MMLMCDQSVVPKLARTWIKPPSGDGSYSKRGMFGKSAASIETELAEY
jgi:hypothetical protein